MLVPSRRRNPVIADVFQRLNYMERRGSGFKKIIGDYEVQHNYNDDLAPVFKSQYDSFFLTLKNLNYNSKISNRVENRAENRVVKKSDEMLQRYKDIKEIIEVNPNVRKREIAEILGLSRQKVDRAIAHSI